MRGPESPAVATRTFHSSGGRHACKARLPTGSMFSRYPCSRVSGDWSRSYTATLTPFRFNPCARQRPPIPPPTIITCSSGLLMNVSPRFSGRWLSDKEPFEQTQDFRYSSWAEARAFHHRNNQFCTYRRFVPGWPIPFFSGELNPLHQSLTPTLLTLRNNGTNSSIADRMQVELTKNNMQCRPVHNHPTQQTQMCMK